MKLKLKLLLGTLAVVLALGAVEWPAEWSKPFAAWSATSITLALTIWPVS